MKTNRTKKIDNQAGFTLIEILIAISIFAVGILGVATMQIAGIHGNATARWQTRAATWGTDRIERLLTVDYDHADMADGSHGPIVEGQYDISWTVTDDQPMDNCKTIVINVSFQDKGIDKTVSFTHYKADI